MKGSHSILRAATCVTLLTIVAVGRAQTGTFNPNTEPHVSIEPNRDRVAAFQRQVLLKRLQSDPNSALQDPSTQRELKKLLENEQIKKALPPELQQKLVL